MKKLLMVCLSCFLLLTGTGCRDKNDPWTVCTAMIVYYDTSNMETFVDDLQNIHSRDIETQKAFATDHFDSILVPVLKQNGYELSRIQVMRSYFGFYFKPTDSTSDQRISIQIDRMVTSNFGFTKHKSSALAEADKDTSVLDFGDKLLFFEIGSVLNPNRWVIQGADDRIITISFENIPIPQSPEDLEQCVTFVEFQITDTEVIPPTPNPFESDPEEISQITE